MANNDQVVPALISKMLDLGMTDKDIIVQVSVEYAPHDSAPEFAQGYLDFSLQRYQPPTANVEAYRAGVDLAGWMNEVARVRNFPLKLPL